MDVRFTGLSTDILLFCPDAKSFNSNERVNMILKSLQLIALRGLTNELYLVTKYVKKLPVLCS